MDYEQALRILQALANGSDPLSGEPFPAASPYQHPDVVRALYHAVRALYHAVRALEAAAAAQKRQANRATAAGNSGKPWSKEEDERLVAAFDAGKPIDELAAAHGRSRLAIEARLARFDKVPMPAGVRAIAAQVREPIPAQYSAHA